MEIWSVNTSWNRSRRYSGTIVCKYKLEQEIYFLFCGLEWNQEVKKGLKQGWRWEGKYGWELNEVRRVRKGEEIGIGIKVGLGKLG